MHIMLENMAHCFKFIDTVALTINHVIMVVLFCSTSQFPIQYEDFFRFVSVCNIYCKITINSEIFDLPCNATSMEILIIFGNNLRVNYIVYIINVYLLLCFKCLKIYFLQRLLCRT